MEEVEEVVAEVVAEVEEEVYSVEDLGELILYGLVEAQEELYLSKIVLLQS